MKKENILPLAITLPCPNAEGYPSCMQTYLLLQHGEVWNEPQNITVYYGSFGYQRDAEYLYSRAV